MAGDLEDELLRRYRDELTFFRRMGTRFARTHPRIARRLELGEGPCPDPHVERLLEGVAFLTARVQSALEADLPDVTTGLLGMMYPHFTRPMPPMAIARFAVDDGGGMTSGLEIPKGTRLFAQTGFQGRPCRFTTAYPLTLWPAQVTQVRLEDPQHHPLLLHGPYTDVRAVLRIRLRSDGAPFSELLPKALQFYLGGEIGVALGVYELLSTGVRGVICVDPDNPPVPGSRPHEGGVRPMGFEPDEAVLPTPPQGLEGYTRLQEYFAFPQKFQFMELRDLDTQGVGQVMDVMCLLTEVPRRRLSITPDNFVLGCAPVVNLFRKLSEPIRLDSKQREYLIIPDARWERTTEIHHVERVVESLNPDAADAPVEPLYGLTHSADPGALYWQAHRRIARQEGYPGTDVWLSFVDSHLAPGTPPYRMLRSWIWCTNRDLASHLDPGQPLYVEDGPHVKITLEDRPTPPLKPPLEGETLWRLISHLSLSHMGLPQGPEAVKALKEQLRLYAYAAPEPIEPQLQGILDVSLETVAMRVGSDQWQGFCRVQRLTLRVDEERFTGARASPILLGAILQQFFGLHAPINVFTQLRIARKQGDIWKTWPPQIAHSALTA